MTVDNAIAALADFLQPLMPAGTEIVRAQVNRVPQPAGPCVVLTELLQVQLETTTAQYNPVTGQAAYTQPKRLDVQMDFYDPSAAEMCTIAQTMLRSAYGVSSEVWPDGVSPLYCNDGVQAPLVTGEQQYESRWTMTVSLQYNAPVTVAQSYFDTVGDVGVIPGDVVYPAE